jgi:tetratricopeptide (TPR) repeat protein
MMSLTLPSMGSARAASAFWLPLLLLSSLCGAARAQGPATAPPPVSEADALIMQGLQLREQGKDSEALRLFERAHQLAPTPRALAQRALAEQALGHWAQAETHLREALAAAGDPWIAQHRQALESSLAVIAGHLGYLQINGGTAGAELRVDGQLVGRLPLSGPLRVVVGRSLLEVTLDGHYPVRREITIKAGALSTETIELVPLPIPQPATSGGETGSAYDAAEQPARDQVSRLPPFVFFTAAGLTAAAFAITLWSGLNTEARNDAYVEYSQQRNATDEESLRGLEAAEDAQTRTNVLIAGTAVAAAATAVIGVFFTDWDGSAGSEADAGARRAPVRVAVVAEAAGPGLLVDGCF